jgi:hypothetical protein
MHDAKRHRNRESDAVFGGFRAEPCRIAGNRTAERLILSIGHPDGARAVIRRRAALAG